MSVVFSFKGKLHYMSYLERYLNGEYKPVWSDLVQLDELVYREDVYEDVLAVAIETMRRVRHNIEVLIPHLEYLGYKFGYEWMEDDPEIGEDWIMSQSAQYTSPQPNVAELLQDFEQQIGGPLPLSLWAFYHEVGEVNFFGRHPAWEQIFRKSHLPKGSPTTLDPLAITGLEETIRYYNEWRETMLEQGENAIPFPLPIAPDYELKYNGSGSGAYEIVVPTSAADGMVLHEWHHTTFVKFLRICLDYGGLPGLELIRDDLQEELTFLRKDLLPF